MKSVKEVKWPYISLFLYSFTYFPVFVNNFSLSVTIGIYIQPYSMIKSPKIAFFFNSLVYKFLVTSIDTDWKR